MENWIKKIMPTFVKDIYHSSKQKYYSSKSHNVKEKIIQYLENKRLILPEEKEVLDYLYKNKLVVFPYDFCNIKDAEKKIDVYLDKDKKLKYVLINDKRLYLKRGWSDSSIASYIASIKEEQHVLSPHCYISDNFQVLDGEVIVDAGAAEGIFALSHIEKAKKIYLFEPDKEWVVALKETFAPWKEKVEIVQKYVSSSTSDQTISLDDYFADKEKPTFIKADIEGFESAMLNGAMRIISSSKNLKMAVCTYHNRKDEEELSLFLSENEFTTVFSHGYMIPYLNRDFKSPYLRRGLIRAIKFF